MLQIWFLYTVLQFTQLQYYTCIGIMDFNFEVWYEHWLSCKGQNNTVSYSEIVLTASLDGCTVCELPSCIAFFPWGLSLSTLLSKFCFIVLRFSPPIWRDSSSKTCVKESRCDSVVSLQLEELIIINNNFLILRTCQYSWDSWDAVKLENLCWNDENLL